MTVCDECGEAKDTVQIGDKNYCLDCLRKQEDSLKSAIEAGADKNSELEEVQDAIWILEES
ncbi:hypothetical protein AKJ44_02960 [candidate division MSBL1 archaeon SCGC-AAA261F17]|uniref:Uncharacterized protein n=1 Tax=candidate division MSBL1 archaeon SCGC-AAA261F17 TaxID=1698274 RepID=A0A133V3V9_9EURY|nr:hypothetical protein AKJ44_02960 [candidate division MSBL1 archaeon SCGC-AAA261F17]